MGADVDDILIKFNNVDSIFSTRIDTSLSLQTNLSHQIIEIDFTLKKIKELLLERKKEIFVKNAPPIWVSLSDTEDSSNISSQVNQIWNSQYRTFNKFYEKNKDSIFVKPIYFILLLLFVFGLKYFSKNINSDEPKVKRTLEILKRPVSAAILIYLLILVLVSRDAPDIYFCILRIAVVLPLLRILQRLINPALRVPLYFFAVLLILQQFLTISDSRTDFVRLLLLLIIIISSSGLIWLLVTKIYDNAFLKPSQRDKAKFITKIILLFFIIAFIANLTGYVMLSSVIVNGTINSLYSIILIITAAAALEGLIIISLQTKPAQKINNIKNHPDIIKQTIAKIIKFIVVVLLIMIILRTFGFRDIVIDWFTEILDKQWSIGNFSISLGNIIVFFLSIWLTVKVAHFVRFVLKGDVLPRFDFDKGVPNAISTLTFYFIIGFGIIIAIMGAGVDLNSFTLLAGALGVGIGFGLQDIVKNFVSGLILIFERPIRIGDAVQVEELSGRVKHIGLRSSIIKTWQGADVIVPNGNLIATKLINWTLSDHTRRIEIVIGVAYGTDINLVMEILLNCAKLHQKIHSSPAPSVLFNDFADSYLEFELRCWTSDYSSWIEIRSELRVAIDKAFKEKNIEIPFPQRDLHLKSGFDFPGDTSKKKDK